MKQQGVFIRNCYAWTTPSS